MIAVTAKNKKISDELIRRGDITHLLSTPQKRFYALFNDKSKRDVALYGSRKMGKSFSLMIILWNYAQQNPSSMIRVVLPYAKMAKDIYEPIFEEFKNLWPSDIFPRWMRSENKLIFSNGSLITFGGAAKDQLDSNRGPRADVVVIDEAPACDSNTMHELIYKILRPQLTTAKFPKFLFTGTPPETPDHYFIKNIYHTLAAKDALVVATIDENDLLSAEQKRQIEEDYGGRQSRAFRREYLAELIGNDDILLVPEFEAEEHVVTEVNHDNGFGQPGYYQTFMALDVGQVDGSGFLSAFYNFNDDKVYILEEFLDVGMSTRQLSLKWKEMEDRLRERPTLYASPIQVVDCFEQTAADLRREFGVSFKRPRKGKTEESIAYLRTCLEMDKIRIHESCKGLITQLQNCVWSDSSTELKKIARSDDFGHGDLVMALAYLIKEVTWGRRPGDKTLAQSFSFSKGRPK